MIPQNGCDVILNGNPWVWPKNYGLQGDEEVAKAEAEGEGVGSCHTADHWILPGGFLWFHGKGAGAGVLRCNRTKSCLFTWRTKQTSPRKDAKLKEDPDKVKAQPTEI